MSTKKAQYEGKQVGLSVNTIVQYDHTCNRLTTLPMDIVRLSKLEVLDVNDNYLPQTFSLQTILGGWVVYTQTFFFLNPLTSIQLKKSS